MMGGNDSEEGAMRWTARAGALLAGAILIALTPPAVPAQGPASPLHVQVADTASVADLRWWDARIDDWLRAGDLQVRRVWADPLVPGHEHERADQYYAGVRVFGGEVVRQRRSGQTVSVFAVLYPDIAVDPTPRLSAGDAQRRVELRYGVRLGPSRLPELMVLPLDGGGYVLAYRARVATPEDVRVCFVDAHTGETVLEYSDRQTQSAVGKGAGVLGDTKKLSVFPQGGQFLARDRLRPPDILTHDLKGNLPRVVDFLNGRLDLTASDLAADADNDWTDGAAVDAHAYAGWTYDYYFKRFGRRGLDDKDRAMWNLVHPVRRQDLLTYPSSVVSTYFLNAFYAGDGVMVYGEGLPAGYVLAATRQTVDYFAGALDIVAHELTHGVTDYTSNLIYRNESGALNEAFSDIMATSVEFFYQPPGSGLRQADYLLGEDVFRPGGIRSLANPAQFDDPDHYSLRYTGTADNGGVHTNSGIANHAFYLAVEGGTNRTSGQRVDGVGSANREQIEKVFYRAFTMLLPANATFRQARAACEQAARDLYGTSSPAFRAVQQAWAAVGVN